MALSRTYANPMLCCVCVKTYPVQRGQSSQMCAVHPDEPLLDIGNEEVRRYLADDDERRRLRAQARWVVGLGVLLASLACGAQIWFVIEEGDGMILGALMGSALGGFIAKKTFRPRYRRWSSDDEVEAASPRRHSRPKRPSEAPRSARDTPLRQPSSPRRPSPGPRRRA